MCIRDRLHLENYTKSDLDFAFRGEYNPESFLILFFIGVIAIIIAMTFGIHKLGKCRVESSSLEGAMDTKYEVFTGGEKEEFSKVIAIIIAITPIKMCIRDSSNSIINIYT